MTSNFEEESRHVALNESTKTTEFCTENEVEMEETKTPEAEEEQISVNCSSTSNKSFELDDDMIIIRRRDVERLTSSLPRLESLDRKLGMASDKKFEEWVYVETDKTTFKIREDLLLLSSVYNDERPCCVMQ